jgi:hypothetical protein
LTDTQNSSVISACLRPGALSCALARRLYPAILAVLLAGGCALRVPPVAEAPSPAADCAALFQEADTAIARAGARDHGPVVIEGFPWLRANRFLASFAPDPAQMESFEAWVGRLGQLDSSARQLELRNHGAGVAGVESGKLESHLERCRSLLQENLLLDPKLRAQLLMAVHVPDDYVTTWRVAGLYPLTAPFVSLGVNRWHAETGKIFDTPLDELPVAGDLQRWRIAYPEAHTGYTPRHDALGIPVLGDDALHALFRRHAPIWEVDVVDHNDRIGTPVFRQAAEVSTHSGTQYHYLSYTRFGERILLQLNYVIWFPARSGKDIYAGNIDGITWRVTLGPGGEPWLYDSIHNCGCYHMYFPTEHLQLREDLPSLGFEPPLVPQRAPQPPLVVRIDSGRHYIQRVYRDTGSGAGAAPTDLAEADYDQLRSLPTPTGHRSFFGPLGLVPGSERGERFLLWPMGVRSPGAMRQRGHHPVAFVGRRHFDDARLIENLFQRRVK